jgi:hypothetical protein
MELGKTRAKREGTVSVDAMAGRPVENLRWVWLVFGGYLVPIQV